MITGKPTFDTLAIAKMEVDLTKGQVHLKCTAAFVDSKSGHTHGWTEGTGAMWSATTMQKLDELRASMEIDLAARHFDGGEVRGRRTEGLDLSEAGDGLAEHLSGTDVPSV